MNARIPAAASTHPSLPAPSNGSIPGSADELVWRSDDAGGERSSIASLAPPPVHASPVALDPPLLPNGCDGTLTPGVDRSGLTDDVDQDVDEIAALVDDLKEFAAAVDEGRRDADRLRWLVGGLVTAIVFTALVLGGIHLSERRDRAPRPTVPDTTELADPSMLDTAAALASDLDDASDELTATSFRWNDPSGQRLDVAVDVLGGTHTIATDDGLELRFDGESYEGRSTAASSGASTNAETGASASESTGEEADGWQSIDGDPFARQPIVGLAGLPTVEDVLPPAIEAHVVADRTDGSTTVVVVDDEALLAHDPDARAAWLATWGLSASGGPTDGIEVLVAWTTADPSDTADDIAGRPVTLAVVRAPALGGEASFELLSFETASG